MSYFEILGLPYAIFLSYLKWARIIELEKTEEGREALYKESAIYQTEPDWNKVRQYTK